MTSGSQTVRSRGWLDNFYNCCHRPFLRVRHTNRVLLLHTNGATFFSTVWSHHCDLGRGCKVVVDCDLSGASQSHAPEDDEHLHGEFAADSNTAAVPEPVETALAEGNPGGSAGGYGSAVATAGHFLGSVLGASGPIGAEAAAHPADLHQSIKSGETDRDSASARAESDRPGLPTGEVMNLLVKNVSVDLRRSLAGKSR